MILKSNENKFRKRKTFFSEKTLAKLKILRSLFYKYKFYFFLSFFFSILSENFIHNFAESLSSIFKKGKEHFDFEFPFSNYFFGGKTFRLKNWIAMALFSFLSFLFCYLANFVHEKISLESYYFLKESMMDKFYNLKFEDKLSKKNEFLLINEEELNFISEHWEHTPIHLITGLYSVFLSFFTNKKFKEMEQIGFLTILSFFALQTLFSSFTLFFNYKLSKKEQNSREILKNEIYLTEKEISKSILIESMGLKSIISKGRIDQSNLMQKAFLECYKLGSLIKNSSYIEKAVVLIPLLLFKENNKKASSNLVISAYDSFIFTSSDISNLVEGFRETVQISFYLKNISNFFLSDEKNENISLGEKVSNKKIKAISLKNVSFKYKNNEKNVIEDHNEYFPSSFFNTLKGKNGFGKSTILYLCLGMINPQKGNVLVHLEDGRIIDLNKDINLKDWKENVVAFLSHDNLFEQNEGSTGQRQNKNIEDVISAKENAQVFIFDEADNSLDEKNKKLLLEKIDILVSEGKIVIFVSHF